jgi:epoxyqueuosine reductase
MNSTLRTRIIDKTLEMGASLAGIASVEDLQKSPSYELYKSKPYYASFEKLPEWSEENRSILVLALYHDPKRPEMDWWDARPGNSPGNRDLITIQKGINRWIVDDLKIQVRNLPYQVEEGGVFLKDAAVLAGIGIIGKNNLLITPQYGPRVRLRALFLDLSFVPVEHIQLNPCSMCSMPCFKGCPQRAFSNGYFERDYCRLQMSRDVENSSPLTNDPDIMAVRYCRVCELSCPVGR